MITLTEHCAKNQLDYYKERDAAIRGERPNIFQHDGRWYANDGESGQLHMPTTLREQMQAMGLSPITPVKGRASLDKSALAYVRVSRSDKRGQRKVSICITKEAYSELGAKRTGVFTTPDAKTIVLGPDADSDFAIVTAGKARPVIKLGMRPQFESMASDTHYYYEVSLADPMPGCVTLRACDDAR